MTNMTTVDNLLHPEWLITVDNSNTILTRHSVVVNDGRIIDILPQEKCLEQYIGRQQTLLDGHALLPGLINTHTHAAMNLFRGLADDMPLMEWLQNHIWPAEQKHINAEFVKHGSQLAIAEMIRSGTTCFNDMYFFPDETARAAVHAGIRATVGLIVIDFPTVWADDAQHYLSRAMQVHDQYRDNPLVNTAMAPHAPYTVSDEPLIKIATYAEELDIPVHMHVHETADEITGSIEQYKLRPLARLEKLGLLSPRLLAVHMTQLNDEEITLSATNGVNIIHCPESNMKLASGVCPAQLLLDMDINVSLGTDSVSSNNDLDMLGEMRSAALLSKIHSGDASSLNANTVLRMATINGARALGLEKETGSLEIGKAADLLAVDLNRLETQPVYDPVAQLVYSAGREQVQHVWVAGKQLLRDGKLTTLDEAELLKQTQNWQKKIAVQ